MLGPLHARVGDRAVHVGGRRAQTVLAALTLERDRAIGVDRLIDVVWADNPPQSARTQVAMAVSALRRCLGQAGGDPTVIETVHGAYRLRAADVRLDASSAESLVRHARAAAAGHAAGHAAALYRNALMLWRGPVLAGLTGPVMDAARMRWEETRLTVTEELAAVELGRGRHREVTGDLMAVVTEHPYRERPRAQLMTALSLAGRQAEALAVYREGRRKLTTELGLEPGAELRDLHQAILAGARCEEVQAMSGLMSCG